MILPTALNQGIRCMPDSNLTVTKSRERTWRERLLSWPWRPWRRLEVWEEPDPSFYKFRDPMTGRETIVAHPAMIDLLNRELGRAS